ncbi:hypothetical protein [Kribbella sp. NPDC003557]|uniref:hypothetical protein n=1 Tax=Kribbella sp. NPDC003557 TaxID=3154449 RepID=UPI0033A56ECE
MAVFAEIEEVESQLESLGLTRSGLERVVSAAVGGYTSTTRFHASSAAGTYLYHEATAALRRVLVPSNEDWDYDEQDQQPRVFSEVRGLTIVAQSGDEYTGLEDPDEEPRARHPKGAATARKVTVNSDQLALFPMSLLVSGADANAPSGMLTWVLLIAIVDGVARSELSLPNQVDKQGKACGWVHRILLPDHELGGAQAETTIGEEPTPDVEVDVEWKQ